MSDEHAFSEALIRHFSPLHPLSADQVARLFQHYALLVRWNRVMNLTSIRALEDAVVRHYCESLFLGIHLPPQPVSVLDAGSGAGFPGLPMAVLRPDCRFTLAESHQRKAVFLREATRQHANVRVLASRVESIPEQFDWVVSRAVRWEDVIQAGGRRFGLLLGQEDAAGLARIPGFLCETPIPLPWGKRRVLVMGGQVADWNPRRST